jgi:UDP-glucuronate 4-epimerase
MFGDGTSRRDYTYVDDIVDGVVRAIDRCASHHLYNLGHSEPIALKDMIETIALALGKRAVIETLPEQPGDVHQTYASIERAQKELGYAPKTAFADGIRRYVAWYRSQPS